MKPWKVFIALAVFCAICMVIGAKNKDCISPSTSPKQTGEVTPGIPNVGSVQVLNACGIDRSAAAVATCLRHNNFDVKNMENAPSWNYPFTMVVSRIRDMRVARQIAAVLKTDKVLLLRTADTSYTVSVYVSDDYLQRIE